MGIFVGYLEIYISIILGSIFFANLFQKRIEACIVIDLFLKMVLMYLFGLMNQLFFGVIIVNILSIFLGIGSIIKNRRKKNMKENIVTNGFFFFSVIYFVFIIFTLNRVTNLWDEYSYWSIITKKMFYSNQLINSGMTIFYPPFPTILQYFFAKTLNCYTQAIELFANYILGFSMLLPLFEKVRTNKKIPNLAISIIILCIPAIFDYILFYQANYADAILGFLIGYILYQVYHEKKQSFLLLSLLLAFIILTLTKATGFYIAGILISVILLQKILEIEGKGKEKVRNLIKYLKQHKKVIFFGVGIIGIIIVLYFSWNNKIKNYPEYKDEIDQQYSQKVSQNFTITDAIKTIFTTLVGSNEKTIYYDSSNRLFFTALYTQYSIMQPIKISVIGFLLLYLIVTMIIYQFWMKEKEKKKYKSFMIATIVGLFLYFLFLQIAYLTKFGILEALKHASFNRYVNTYYLGIFFFLLSIIVTKIEETNKNLDIKYLLLIGIILLITPFNILTDATIASGNKSVMVGGELIDARNAAIQLKEKLKPEDRIYLVNQESDTSVTSWQLKYFLVPEIDIKTTRQFSETMEDAFQGENLLENWKQNLSSNYDYLYVFKTDEYFNTFASSLFEHHEIKEKTIYKIEKENSTLKLIEVKE